MRLEITNTDVSNLWKKITNFCKEIYFNRFLTIAYYIETKSGSVFRTIEESVSKYSCDVQ